MTRQITTRYATRPYPAGATLHFVVRAVLIGILMMLSCATVLGQVNRQQLLDGKPLATATVQSLKSATKDYSDENRLMLYQPEEEDPLSFYVRTQDGEWLIPAQVNRANPWVRLLILSPSRPTIADVAIEINSAPYRDAREQWIDKLLADAQKTFLLRTGAATAEAAGFDADEAAASESSTDEEVAEGVPADTAETASEGTSETVVASEEAADDFRDPSAEESDAEEPDVKEADELPMVAAQVERRALCSNA